MLTLVQSVIDDLRNGRPPCGISELRGLPTPHQRLVGALLSDSASPHDRAILARHVLRMESELHHGTQQKLTIPTDGWPATGELSRFGLLRMDNFDGTAQLSADPWTPEWLLEARGISPELESVLESPRRMSDPVNGDVFLASLGRAHYLSESQKEAVRSVLLAPAGATLAVNLPTGFGKSLCAHILAKVPQVGEDQCGLTVVVVPTVALALDQARALEPLLHQATAYVGGNDVGNREIRTRILDGQQSIVFAAPESLAGGLRRVLYETARKGVLKNLVIDEAHMVSQWGDSFRSSFQELSGLRRSLLRTCSDNGHPLFRTVLLSATMTDMSIRTLECLFGQPGPFKMVSAVQLRPEPSYWMSRCDTRKDKEERILEAVCHLPRPLILYTTEVREARDWFNRTRRLGFRRTGLFTGVTSSDERRELVSRWSANELDMMVATSAFGLGVDRGDVRSVVHACVPETLDRFYQEVGRGGRDGKACVSMLIYYEADDDNRDDWNLARSLNNSRIITPEKGFPRWQSMLSHSEMLEPGLFRIPIDCAPGLDVERIDMVGTRNAEWNTRTLTLMARSGLIVFDDLPPTREPSDSEADQPMPDAEESHSTRIVKILDKDHGDYEHWTAITALSRELTRKEDYRLLRLMRVLLAGRECSADVLERAYSVPDRGIAVARSCGGCAACRRNGGYSFADSPHHSGIPWQSRLPVHPRLEAYLAGTSAAVFSLPTSLSDLEMADKELKLVRWLADSGIRLLVCDPSIQARILHDAYLRTSYPLFFENRLFTSYSDFLPTAVFSSRLPVLPDHLMSEYDRRLDPAATSTPLILVVREDIADPDRSDRLLRDRCLFIDIRRISLEQGI